MIILIVLLVALGTALLFRLLHWLLRPLTRRRFWLRMSYLLMGVELLAWTAWLFWLIRLLVRNEALYAYFTVGVAFLLFGLLTWFLLRDLVAGIIFKLQHNLKLNQSIRVMGRSSAITPKEGGLPADAITGRLLRLGITTIVLESAAGERIKIPYTKLINESVARYDASEVINPYDMELSVPKSQSKDRWISALSQQILLLPWASTIRTPIVQWQRESEQHHVFDLRVYCLSNDQAYRIESHLRHVYSDK